MEGPVLLTYLTSSKDVWEITEIMAAELKKQGIQVDAIPAGKVESISQYRKIILGAPIYMFIWPKNLHRFLSRLEESLKDHPVTIFSIGPSLDQEEESEKARVQINDALEKFGWFKLDTIKFFSINFSKGDLPFPFNLFQKPLPVEELMDWAALKAWIRETVKE